MKLSIIVPVYNLEKYIAAALESLLSIRFSGVYEIVVVNDGSTDASGEIICSYQRRNANIRLFTTENQGVSAARNLGIRRAAGQYITFMDGDDTVEPDFFERAVRELDSGGYDFVQGNIRFIEKNQEYLRQFTDRDVELCDRKEMMRLFLQPCQVITSSVWGKVFRGDVVRRVQFDTALSITEDQKYVFDVLCMAEKIKLLTAVSIHYIQRSDSAYHTLTQEKIDQENAVLAHIRAHIPYPDLDAGVEGLCLSTLMGQYYTLRRAKDPKAGELRRTIQRFPLGKLQGTLDKTTRNRYFLHKYAGWLYDLYILYCK